MANPRQISGSLKSHIHVVFIASDIWGKSGLKEDVFSSTHWRQTVSSKTIHQWCFQEAPCEVARLNDNERGCINKLWGGNNILNQAIIFERYHFYLKACLQVKHIMLKMDLFQKVTCNSRKTKVALAVIKVSASYLVCVPTYQVNSLLHFNALNLKMEKQSIHTYIEYRAAA